MKLGKIDGSSANTIAFTTWVLEIVIGYVMTMRNISNSFGVAVLCTIGPFLKSSLIFTAFQFHGEAPRKVA